MKNRTKLKVSLVAALFSCVLSIGWAQASDSQYRAFVENIEGDCVIVTGSNRGQGLGWVKHFLREGDSVIATCRKPAAADDLNALRQKYGDQLLIEQLDVTNEAHHQRLGEMWKKHGVKIDVAISNAGVTLREEFGKWTRKGLLFNIEVNTVGAALFAQTIAPSLKDGARIMQISSGVGSIALQKRSNDLDGYGISKAGLNYLGKRLAVKLADRNIIVVSVTPGSVLTDMNPKGTISVEKAVSIMAATLENLTMEDSGSFIRNNGKTIPW